MDREHPEGAETAGLPQIWRRIHEHKTAKYAMLNCTLAYGIQHAVVLTSEAFDWPPQCHPSAARSDR